MHNSIIKETPMLHFFSTVNGKAHSIMDYRTSFNITITWLLQQFPTFLVNPYIHLKTDAINMLTRWLATDRPVWKCTLCPMLTSTD